MKSFLIIYNSNSGTTDQDKVKQLIIEFFKSKNINLSWYITTGSNDLKKLTEAVKINRPEIIIASGGDGTCNLTANVAISFNIPMAIIPTGSANALAKELDIPLDPKEALAVIYKGQILKIDYLLVNGKICIRQAGVGVNAQLIKSFETSQSRGMLMYAFHFIQNLFKWRTFSAKVYSDSKYLKKRNIVSLTFASSTKYGTGALINPTGSIDDGKFEIILIRRFPWYTLPSLSYRFYKGSIHESIYSDTIRCTQAAVHFKKKRLLQIDGELSGKHEKIKVTVVRKGLQIITPSNTMG